MIQLVFDAADAARGARGASRSRSGTARTRGPSGLPGTTKKLEIVDGTHPVVYPAAGSHAEQVHGGPLPRQLGRGRGRLRRHARPAPGAQAGRPDHPQRRRGRRRRVPVDHLRGALGRAAEGVLQRADRPEHEDAVDDADRVVRGLARPQLRGADRGHPRDGRHRLLLHRRSRRAREALSALLRSPAATFLVIAAILGLIAFVVIRATWTPRRRRSGSRAAARGVRSSPSSASMYVKEARLFLGLGLLLIPTVFVITASNGS